MKGEIRNESLSRVSFVMLDFPTRHQTQKEATQCTRGGLAGGVGVGSVH